MTVTNLKAKPITSSQSLRKQIEILNYHIKNAPTHSIVITFTPELAEYILTNYNKNNRPLKHGKIIEYANYMTDTKWLLTGATLVFGSDVLLPFLLLCGILKNLLSNFGATDCSFLFFL